LLKPFLNSKLNAEKTLQLSRTDAKIQFPKKGLISALQPSTTTIVEVLNGEADQYYKDLSTDYSKPQLVDNELVVKLLQDAETFISLREETFPEITSEYSYADRTGKGLVANHCEAQRQGREIF